MTKIIGISGRKQSGKNTTANFICGDIMNSKDLIQDYKVNEQGELIVKTNDSSGKTGWGILDLLRKDEPFVEYADRELWPYVKIYHFADALKQICTNVFGIDHDMVYGTDEQKNQKTDLLWEKMPFNSQKKRGNMTSREFMQHFGTNVMRRMKNDVWVETTISMILKENPCVAIIPDVRFPNEVEMIQKNNGVCIRLTRNVFNDNHPCEQALDSDNFSWDKFDKVLHNEVDVKKLCEDLAEIKDMWRIEC